MKNFTKTIENILADTFKQHIKKIIKIDIGQAILIILNCFDKQKNELSAEEQECVQILEKLFLEGKKTQKDKEQLLAIIKTLKGFNISIDLSHKAVFTNTSKRYFETHLARHILENKSLKYTF